MAEANAASIGLNDTTCIQGNGDDKENIKIENSAVRGSDPPILLNNNVLAMGEDSKVKEEIDKMINEIAKLRF